MDAIVRLEIVEAVKRLKARYCLHLDGKDWDGWRDLFADDVVMDVSGSAPPGDDPERYRMRGGDAVLASVRRSLDGVKTAHHCHTPIIDVHGEDAASAIWAMQDKLIFPDGRCLDGFGHYHETYRRIDGAWKIATTRLTRLILQFTTAD